MEAPNPLTAQNLPFSIIKELKSEQGHNFSLRISFINNKFNIQIDKTGKTFSDVYINEFTINHIQENQYFKIFSNPKEIMEELNERIDSKRPVLNEINNNSVNLIIFLPTSKFKQIEFNLTKKEMKIDDLRYNFEKLIDKIEELEKENKEIKEENKRIIKENKEIKEEIYEIKKIVNEIKLTQKPFDFNKKIPTNNFHWINKEVNIFNHSKFLENFQPEIVLGKSTIQPYSLTEPLDKSDIKHFIEFSFIKNYFLKSIRIKVSNYSESSLKTFSIEIYW